MERLGNKSGERRAKAYKKEERVMILNKLALPRGE
jgi:hypothetical protein